eukprot:Skav203260  [mRNA]  locus=scaffold2987:9349:10848:+ [translate_table: standard]
MCLDSDGLRKPLCYKPQLQDILTKFFSGLSREIEDAIEQVANKHEAQVVLSRKKFLHHWIQVAKETDVEDNQAKSSMCPLRANILKPKRLELLGRMISTMEYPDVNLAKDISSGFDLVRKIPSSEVLPKKFSPAAMSVEDLKRNATQSRIALKKMTASTGDQATDQGLWDKTMAEVDKGWLVGPLDWDSLESHCVVSRRFAVVQGEKIRPIDDYSQSQVNSTIFAEETASVDNVDFICAMLCRLMHRLAHFGKNTSITTRSLDLSSAYRQLTISDESQQFAYISVYSPVTGRAELFRQVALPFGSKAAVNAFIRCARCIQWIAATGLSVPLSCYFDDFVIASTLKLANNTQATMSLLLDLLGWAFDKVGPKADSFSPSTAALGVVFDMQLSESGRITVSNTEKRTREVVDMIDGFLDSGVMSFKEAQVARGRLAFCDAFIFGRAGRSALQEISSHGYAKPFRKEIGHRLRIALERLRDRMLHGKPTPVRVFLPLHRCIA